VGIFDDLFTRRARRRRRAELQRVLDRRRLPAEPQGFDEFGAPEGGFGRVDGLMVESRAPAADVDPVRA
jgi:hypothetical protein